MNLTELLCEEAVCMSLQAAGRDEVIGELLSRLVEMGRLSPEQLEPAMKAIVRREALGSTAIGRGVAVPHARVKGLDQIVIAVGLTKEGVEFNALDGEPVHAVFLVAGSEEAPDEYLAVMQKIGGLMQDSDFRRFLLRARTPGEVLELIQEMDT